MKEKMNKPVEKATDREKKDTKLLLIICAIAIGVTIIGFTISEFTNIGTVTGTFISGNTKNGTIDTLGYGGPSTTIRLSNYSMSGPEPVNNEDNFFFDNYYPNISNLVEGHRYVIEFKQSGESHVRKYTIRSIKEI